MLKAVVSNALQALPPPPPPPSNSLEPGSGVGKKAKKEASGPYICSCHLKRGVFFNDRYSRTTFQCSGSRVRRSDGGERVKLYTGKTGQGGRE